MWRYYEIETIPNGRARTIYAPSLRVAFHIARCQGAGSATLVCTGSRATKS